jgi:hypothetical protein
MKPLQHYLDLIAQKYGYDSMDTMLSKETRWTTLKEAIKEAAEAYAKDACDKNAIEQQLIGFDACIMGNVQDMVSGNGMTKEDWLEIKKQTQFAGKLTNDLDAIFGLN